MIFADQNNDIHYQDAIIGSVEKRANPYQIFVYKKLEDSTFEIYADSSPHEDHKEEYEFLGSITIFSDPDLDLAEKKKQLFSHLYNTVDKLHKNLLSNYSALEVETWKQQEEEARALLSVKTPILDALCAVRSCSRDDLALKIVTNAEAAKSFGMNILSWQQGIEKEMKTMSLEDFTSLWETISNKTF